MSGKRARKDGDSVSRDTEPEDEASARLCTDRCKRLQKERAEDLEMEAEVVPSHSFLSGR